MGLDGKQLKSGSIPSDRLASTYANTVVLVDGSRSFIADQSMGGHKISDLALPSLSTDAANRQYVDNSSTNRVFRAGDTMTGFLTLFAAPSNNMHAATKQYVDARVKLDGTTPLTGHWNLGGFKIVNAMNPANPQDYVTKAYGDANYINGGMPAGGPNTSVQYNSSGAFGGSANLTWDGSTLAATAFSGAGSALTDLDAGEITSGSLDNARLSANVPFKNVQNHWTDSQYFECPVLFMNLVNIAFNSSDGLTQYGILTVPSLDTFQLLDHNGGPGGKIDADGSLLTNLTGANIAPNADIPDGALSANVAHTDDRGTQTFYGRQIFNGDGCYFPSFLLINASNGIRIDDGTDTGIYTAIITAASPGQVNFTDGAFGGTPVHIFAIGDLLTQLNAAELLGNIPNAALTNALSAWDGAIIPNADNLRALGANGAAWTDMYSYIDYITNSAGDAPAVAGNTALFTKTVTGKIKLYARFPTGAIQLIASEP